MRVAQEHRAAGRTEAGSGAAGTRRLRCRGETPRWRPAALCLVTISVSAVLPGCYRHSAIDLTRPAELEQYQPATEFRVTTIQDRAFSVDSLTLGTDSVVGRLSDGTRTAVARAHVFRIERRGLDVVRTVRGAAQLALAVFLIVGFTQMGPL